MSAPDDLLPPDPDAGALAELTAAVIDLRAQVARQREAIEVVGIFARVVRVACDAVADAASEIEAGR